MKLAKFVIDVAIIIAVVLFVAQKCAHADEFCVQKGRDCVEELFNQSVASYCGVVAEVAKYGAQQYAKGAARDTLPKLVASKLRDRPLTTNERVTMEVWLRWGYDWASMHQNADPDRARHAAQMDCMKGRAET